MDHRGAGGGHRWGCSPGSSLDGLIATFSEEHAFAALSGLVALFLGFMARQQAIRDAAGARRISHLEGIVSELQRLRAEEQRLFGQLNEQIEEKDRTIADLRRGLSRYTDESMGA